MAAAEFGPMAPLLFLHLFLAVAAVVMGKTARDALLLPAFSPVTLALLDIVTLLAVLGVLAIQLRTSGRFSAPRLLSAATVCFAAGDMVLAAAGGRSPGLAMALATYVWLGVQASFMTAHAALSVNGVAARTGRGTAAAGLGAVLGWIAGGAVARVMAAAAGATSLVVGAGLLTLALPLLVASRASQTAEPSPTRGSATDRRTRLCRAPRTIWRSPHLRVAAGITLCSAAASSIATFQFRSAAVHLGVGTDDLAVFLGSFHAYAGAAALGIQVVSVPLIRRLGRGVDLMLAPGTMVLASIAVLLSGTFAAAVVLRGSDQVFRYSVDRTARERLYQLVPRGELFDGRTFIETAVFRLGDIAGTLVAIAAVLVAHLPFTSLSVPVVLLALACVGLALGSRRVPAALDASL